MCEHMGRFYSVLMFGITFFYLNLKEVVKMAVPKRKVSKGSSKFPVSPNALSAANTTFRTEFAETARPMPARIIPSPKRRLKKQRHNGFSLARSIQQNEKWEGKMQSLLLFFYSVPYFCEFSR